MKTNSTTIEQQKRTFYISPGVRFRILGSVLFSIGAASIKLAGTYVPASQILFARAILGLCFCLWIARRTGFSPFLGKQKGLLLLRGIFGGCAFFTMICAYVRLPLADATVIIFLHPVLVAILASILLKEKLRPQAWLCIMVSLVGVAIVSRPGFIFGQAHQLDPSGVLMALAGVLFSSLAILSVRQLAKTEPTPTIMFYPLLIIFIAAPLMGGMHWTLPTPEHFLFLLMAGGFMNAGQFFMTKGYGLGSAATISAVGYLEIVFAAFWGMTIFGELPDLPTIAGSVLIAGSTYALGRLRQK